MKYLNLSLVILILNITCSFSRTVLQPNSSLKSHETLEISKVELSDLNTTVYMKVENRIGGGTFCADRDIYLIDPEGERYKLEKSSGIPVCPDYHMFKSIGETIEFILTFPPLKKEIKWFDIVEECEANCFWFYGVTLDNDLNKRLDEAFSIASKGKQSDHIYIFKSILDSVDNQNLGIEGLLYINIINAAVDNTDYNSASDWYRRLASSNAPRLAVYIKYLNDNGIMY